MQTMTLSQAAMLTHRNHSTIHRLVRAKKIPALQTAKGKHWFITASPAEVKAIVAAEVPRGGYYRTAPTNGTAPAKTAPRTTAPDENRLAALVDWIAIPKEKRELLLTLARLCSEADLALLVSLVE